jgi:arginine exporter protein ArgO
VIAALVAGLLAGYGIAMPVGAVGTYLVALTARTSLKIGACAALGVATADGVYAVVAVVGGSALAPLLEPLMVPLRWVSCLLLLGLGIRGAVKAIRQYYERRLAGANAELPVSATRAYLGLLGMTLLNPMTVVYFAALVLGGQGTADPGHLERAVFVLAAFTASASWQLALASGGALLGRALTGPRGRLLTALASSLVITVLALALVT